MNTQYFRAKYSLLSLAIIASIFIGGCSTWPLSRKASSSEPYNIEGKWSQQQDGPGGPWHGTFVLEKKGNSYAGTLNDLSENTYGDKILDVKVSNEHIKLTRNGRYGVQYWEGKLKEENGQLKIIDGRWKKVVRPNSFSAEKRE